MVLLVAGMCVWWWQVCVCGGKYVYLVVAGMYFWWWQLCVSGGGRYLVAGFDILKLQEVWVPETTETLV